jgi:hypothetical protein
LLLWATEHIGRQPNVVANQQGADTRRAMKLVRGQRQSGGAQFLKVHRQLTYYLCGIGVQRNSMPTTAVRYSGHRLQHACFIMAQQGGDQPS